jgi:hypothetical protein
VEEPLGKSLVAYTFAAALISMAASAEELSYHGWTGSANFESNRFIGCHLDSPASLTEPYDPIRVVAENSLQFFIQFNASFENPQPTPDTTGVVHLGLVNGEKLLNDDWSSHSGYRVRILSNGARGDGKHFTRELLALPSDDDVMSHLPAARYLKVYFPTTENFQAGINFVLIDLRHRSAFEPKTWLGALDSNDTYGAIKEVIACVGHHGGGTPAEAQAQFDFETALRVDMVDFSRQRPGPLEDMKGYGSFYCSTKKQVPYDDGTTYVGNVNETVMHAAALWERQHFVSSEEAQRSPLMTTDEIGIRDSAMATADQHLCPGWPGHPRTEQ